MASNEKKTYFCGFFLKWTKIRYHDGLASYNQYIHHLNMEYSSKTILCDFIYIYCKVSFPAVENQEEADISVRAYVMLMQQQQQASDDEIYEG